MQETTDPVVGLSYVTEFFNPADRRDCPMYTCSLAGCKSAWGFSDDMFNHVIKDKHQRNWLLHRHDGNESIAVLTRNEVLMRVIDYCDQNPVGVDDIRKVYDRLQYEELRSRPKDWSESKAKVGVTGRSMSANFVKLGTTAAADTTSSGGTPGLFDASWDNWRPPSRDESCAETIRLMRNHVGHANDMVNNFSGDTEDTYYDDCVFFLESLKGTITMTELAMSGGSTVTMELEVLRCLDTVKVQLADLETQLSEKAARGSAAAQTSRNAPVAAADQSSAAGPDVVSSPPRCEDIAAAEQVNGDRESQRLMTRRAATETFRSQLTRFLLVELEKYAHKIPDESAREELAVKLVEEKLFPAELASFEKKHLSWDMFLFGRKQEVRVTQFMKMYLDTKYRGHD